LNTKSPCSEGKDQVIRKSFSKIILDILDIVSLSSRVAEPEPAGAETFGWSRSRNIEVPAPGQPMYFEKI
jgi:hypothetical protein